MNNYQKLMCVKGLILSLDEQLFHFRKTELDPNEHRIIVNKYYDAILESNDPFVVPSIPSILN